MVKSGLTCEHYTESPALSAHLTLKTAFEGSIIIFSLEMKELRPREVKWLAQDHTARKETS